MVAESSPTAITARSTARTVCSGGSSGRKVRYGRWVERGRSSWTRKGEGVGLGSWEEFGCGRAFTMIILNFT